MLTLTSVATAIAHYRKVLEDSPNNITALNNLAYHLTGDPQHADEALKLALRLKKLAPNRPAVDDTLGWAYYNTGAYDWPSSIGKRPFRNRANRIAGID